LPVDDGGVACSIFEILSGGACEPTLGLSEVDASVASKVEGRASVDAAGTVCVLQQLDAASLGGSCATSVDPGWCYVTGAAAGACTQAILFSQGAVEPEAVVVLGCQ
jgi:hypothetical protein